jgi:hypothetical protein
MSTEVTTKHRAIAERRVRRLLETSTIRNFPLALT